MSPSAIDDHVRLLVADIEQARHHMADGERLNDAIRWTARISKVAAALLTSVAAVFTGATGSAIAAWLTAIAGILTVLVEIVAREFAADAMRAHYYVYHLEFKQLLARISLETNLSDDALKKYLGEFQTLEKREVETRPTLQIK